MYNQNSILYYNYIRKVTEDDFWDERKRQDDYKAWIKWSVIERRSISFETTYVKYLHCIHVLDSIYYLLSELEMHKKMSLIKTKELDLLNKKELLIKNQIIPLAGINKFY